MKRLLLAMLAVSCGRPHRGLVDLQRINPQIRLEMRYAGADNFTHQKLYDRAKCYLQAETAQKLDAVQRELERGGLGLKMWDCYRPLSVQKKFWALVPDERYVANPAKGSRHNRGAAVDLTLVRSDGTELAMPTAHDDFTRRAHRDFQDLSPEVLRNRALLEQVMVRHGFVPFPTEWWHFDDSGWQAYPVMDVQFSRLP